MRLLVPLLFLFSAAALSHQTSLTSSQKEIRWNTTNIPVRIINNSSSYPSSNSLIEESIAEWNNLSDLHIYKTSGSSNQIKFSNDFSIYGSAVVGVTEVSYGSNGIINTASITLNDQHYDFTDNPATPVGSYNPITMIPYIFLKDVLTHELGHFVGLSHSEVLNSSMFYSNFPGQATLAADDRAGIKSKYDASAGKIYGYVKGGNQIGVMGVHVQAISRKTGEAIGAISDENGYFSIGGLELDDSYYLYTSSLKNLESLPSHFSSVQTEFCPSSYVGSFFSPCGRENDGLPTAINLNSLHPQIDVGVVSISCTLRTQEDYTYEKIQSSFDELPIFDYASEQRWEKSFVGFFRKSQLTATSALQYTAPDKFLIDLTGLPFPNDKKLRLRLISQPFGNVAAFKMTLKRGSTLISISEMTTNSLDNVKKLDLTTTDNISSSALVYHVEIGARKLTGTETAYSMPDVTRFGIDQTLPYLLVVSLEDEAFSAPLIDTESDLSDNASCLDAPFTFAVAKSRVAADEDKSSTSEAAAGAAGCGTIEPPSGPGPGNFMFMLTAGFMISVLAARFVKRGKNFLS